jgi:orotate phosphoribosyltransferase
MSSLRQQFIEFALTSNVLRFGEITMKSGRRSPYFFNAGLFNRGALLGQLARFYARTLLAARAAGKVEFDMLFGPAYKGITLAGHGEGGVIVGAPLAGRVVIVDDVITDGAAKRESIDLIRAHGARPVAVLIALDRMERVGADDALSERSAVQQLELDFGIPVLTIADLGDLLAFVGSDSALAAQAQPHRAAIETYRRKYGVH